MALPSFAKNGMIRRNEAQAVDARSLNQARWMPPNRLEFSKQREEDCKALRIKTKSDQDSLEFFEELRKKLVHL